MKFFVVDQNKLTKFDLPSRIEEMILFSYYTDDRKIEHVITVEAEQEKWCLKSNGNVNIVQNGTRVSSIYLSELEECQLELSQTREMVKLFCLPTMEVYSSFANDSLDKITVGNGKQNHINYPISSLLPVHFTIQKKDQGWDLIISDVQKCFVYVNGRRVIHHVLHRGDIIFVESLKIIWMESFLKVNYPGVQLHITGLKNYQPLITDNIHDYHDVSDEELKLELYKDEDYFFHTPRLRSSIEKYVVTIDSPPSSPLQEELPFILTLGTSITMAASSMMTGMIIIQGLSSGNRTVMDVLPQIVMCAAMIFGSLIMPRVTQRYHRKQREKKEKLRQEKYRNYIALKETEISHIMSAQKQLYYENHKSIDECKAMVLNHSSSIWNREIRDEDFLTVRMGIGNIAPSLEIKVPEEHFSLEDDDLKQIVYQLPKKYHQLEQVPIIFSFLDKTISSIICNTSFEQSFIDGILLQLITYHSGGDLKIVFLTEKNREDRWAYMKNLSHCWSNDHQIRFFASNLEESKEVLSYLEKEYKKRQEDLKNNKGIKEKKEYCNFLPYFLIITDHFIDLKDNQFLVTLSEEKQNFGFSCLILEKSMRHLPTACEAFIQVTDQESCIFEKEISVSKQQIFRAETSFLDMSVVSSMLAKIPVVLKESQNQLPLLVSFLEMFHVSKIEQLNILNRWQTNQPVSNLQTPVGVHKSGDIFQLDLHEKFHGPHGLIAGMTGSGKSEFIITYILSMAVNYHPYEVQFVLIDYKGGGLAGAFENKDAKIYLPHLVGTITNLDENEMNRTLVSIESELKRRQKKFKEVRDNLGEGTIDIYKYQRLYREGIVKESMSHLFIVCDEFAELKSQQPEFMQQLISTARIGRSLGVHLILATQKPSGVVNDQIWSNSKFKVCLKVQDRSDSMEMLKKPDAANIKETGRFYLQVGYDDYFDVGQSAWSGARYVPTDTIIYKKDDSVEFINNIGYITKSINDIPKQQITGSMGDQLTNVVKYIYQLGVKQGLRTHKLWLDSIPSEVYLQELKKKYQYHPIPYVIAPVIGEFDNPKEQKQGLLQLELTKNGNTVIYGQVGSGKENLIYSILFSATTEHTPQEVSFYIIDCGSESLKVFHKYPHVGGFITIDETAKIIDLFIMVEEELELRKSLFADYGGDYVNYCENSGQKLPMMVIIINNYDMFQETYSKFADGIQPFLRDGSKYGITFIVTAIMTSAVRGRMLYNFNNKICLQLQNNSEYRSILNGPKGLFPAKLFGRGVIAKDETAYEFQTALICDRKNITNAVRTFTNTLIQHYQTRARMIPTVPNVVTPSTLPTMFNLINVPIGFDIESKKPYQYNFLSSPITMILAQSMEEKLGFVKSLFSLLQGIPSVTLKVIDFYGWFQEMSNKEGYIFQEMEQHLVNLNNDILRKEESDNTTVYAFVGIGLIRNQLTKGGRMIINNIFTKSGQLAHSRFLFIDSIDSYHYLELEPWYLSQIDQSTGIWLGEGISNQMSLRVNGMSLDDKKKSYPDMGLVISNGKYKFIKYVVEEDQNEG